MALLLITYNLSVFLCEIAFTLFLLLATLSTMITTPARCHFLSSSMAGPCYLILSPIILYIFHHQANHYYPRLYSSPAGSSVGGPWGLGGLLGHPRAAQWTTSSFGCSSGIGASSELDSVVLPLTGDSGFTVWDLAVWLSVLYSWSSNYF